MANFDSVFKDVEIKKSGTHPKRITKWIHYTKLVPNKKQYRDPAEQQSREEALALLIQADGEVLQDLIVRKVDADEYEIIAGHTRWGACRRLVEEEKEKQYEFLPCIVKDISDVRATFQVFSSNGYSEKTQYEKMHEIEEMKHLIETYPEEFPDLQKGRMVERLSKHFRIDKSTIGEYLQISNNLGDEAMELFEKGKLKKSAAVKLSSLEREEQRQLVQSGIITTKEIEIHKQTRKVEQTYQTVIDGHANLFAKPMAIQEQLTLSNLLDSFSQWYDNYFDEDEPNNDFHDDLTNLYKMIKMLVDRV